VKNQKNLLLFDWSKRAFATLPAFNFALQNFLRLCSYFCPTFFANKDILEKSV
jgi:hypothetical protein